MKRFLSLIISIAWKDCFVVMFSKVAHVVAGVDVRYRSKTAMNNWTCSYTNHGWKYEKYMHSSIIPFGKFHVKVYQACHPLNEIWHKESGCGAKQSSQILYDIFPSIALHMTGLHHISLQTEDVCCCLFQICANYTVFSSSLFSS